MSPSSISQSSRWKSLLTVKDAAAMSGITPWWVRQLIARGELRAINVGSHGTAAKWRIEQTDLDAWLLSRQNRARDLH